MIIYSFFDKVANEYGPLFECVNDGVALRQFEHMLKKMDEADREDLALYRIGEFDRADGEILPVNFANVIEEVKNGTGV
jgi:hypothetical protein